MCEKLIHQHVSSAKVSKLIHLGNQPSLVVDGHACKGSQWPFQFVVAVLLKCRILLRKWIQICASYSYQANPALFLLSSLFIFF